MKTQHTKKTSRTRGARAGVAKPASMDKFGVWKTKAALYAKTHPALCLDDILALDDPYDLADAMPAAFKAGQSPEDFIEEVFEEDITSREYDEHLAAEAYEHELAELGRAARQRPIFLLVNDPKARSKSYWSGTRWTKDTTKDTTKAKRYSGHDGEHDAKQMRRRGFAKASLIDAAVAV